MTETTTPTDAPTMKPTRSPEDEMGIDPVCGMTVEPQAAAGGAAHDGKTY